MGYKYQYLQRNGIISYKKKHYKINNISKTKNMEPLFTIEQIKNYIFSQDSMGDILYNLNEHNILKANCKTVEEEDELDGFDEQY